MTQLTKQSIYTGLSGPAEAITRTAAEEIKEAVRRTAAEIVYIGGKLVEVQEHLKGNGFQQWCNEEFGWSKSQAYNYINAYNRFGARPNFGQLDIATSAINLLAAPSTPDDVVEEIVSKAEAGEKITYSQAKQAIDNKKQPVVNSLPGTEGMGVQPRTAAEFNEQPKRQAPPPLPTAPAQPAAAPPPLPTAPSSLPPVLGAAVASSSDIDNITGDDAKEAALLWAQMRILEIAQSRAYARWEELNQGLKYKVILDQKLVHQNAVNLLNSPTLRSAAQFSSLNAEVRVEE